MKAVIVGSGSWGTGIAQVLADNKQDVTIWGIDKDELNDIKVNHQNAKYFPDVKLNENIKVSSDLEVASDADVVVLSVPTIAIEDVCKSLNKVVKHKIIIVNTSKGFHPITNERMSCVIRDTMDENKLSSVVSLIGPSHAEEVVLRMLTTICAVSLNDEDAKFVQSNFSNDYLRVYTGNDEIGSEVGVAIKNAIAVASGTLAGLGYGDNTKAALITRGLKEMITFGMAMGGKFETFMGLTGIGDLIVTCTSVHSRNFQAGYEIGKHNDAQYFWDNNSKTVEGVRTSKVVHELAINMKLDLPIINEIYKVLYENKKPSISANDLMLRDLKEEM
ncbi:MAG: NAD(P)H-dependent glycerol-3-phosphate dehydrogenase [Erysipelotrichaceae bacterium]